MQSSCLSCEAALASSEPKVGVPQKFDIVTAGAAPPGARPTCQAVVTEPSGRRVPAKLAPAPKGFAAEYTPHAVGPHTVEVLCEGQQVPQSPLRVNAEPDAMPVEEEPMLRRQAAPRDEQVVAPRPWRQDSKGPPPSAGPSTVRAFGDGLYWGVANQPANFTIDSRNAEPAPLNVTLEGPSEAVIDCRDNGDGTCNVAYTVSEPGPYAINILYQDRHIPSSPFTANIGADPNARPDVSRVRAYGPGLQPTGSVRGAHAHPVSFRVPFFATFSVRLPF